MSTYLVTIPEHHYRVVRVEAANEEDAVYKAEEGKGTVVERKKDFDDDLDTWEAKFVDPDPDNW